MVDAPDADSCQILQVSGDFTGALDGDVSNRMVGLQCGMCLGDFPSCVNTVQSKKCSDPGRAAAQRNVTGSFCAPTVKKEKIFRTKPDTCDSGSSSHPARRKNGNSRGRTVGDRLKCLIGVLVRIIAAGALKI